MRCREPLPSGSLVTPVRQVHRPDAAPRLRLGQTVGHGGQPAGHERQPAGRGGQRQPAALVAFRAGFRVMNRNGAHQAAALAMADRPVPRLTVDAHFPRTRWASARLASVRQWAGSAPVGPARVCCARSVPNTSPGCSAPRPERGPGAGPAEPERRGALRSVTGPEPCGPRQTTAREPPTGERNPASRATPERSRTATDAAAEGVFIVRKTTMIAACPTTRQPFRPSLSPWTWSC